MDLGRLRLGEVVAGLAGVVLIAAMLALDWYGVEAPGAPPVSGFNAFQAFDVVDVLLLATALSAIALATLTASQRTSAIPIALSAFVTLGAIVVSLVLVFRIVDEPDLSGARPEFALITGFHTTLEPGVFIGLAATLAIAVGGWLAMRDDR